jgi:hypothetical protein
MTRRRQHQAPVFSDGEVPVNRISAAGLLLFGLAIGLAVALYYAWVLSPVVYTDASPARFSQSYKEEYIFLVSQNYAATGDWEQAEQRLLALNDPNLHQTVEGMLEKYLREQKTADSIRNLANLAQKLGVEGEVMVVFAPTPLTAVSPTPTSTPDLLPTPTATLTRPPTQTPISTATLRPTDEPSATPRPNYRLLFQEPICEDEPAPRIEVETLDAFLTPEPGIEVIVRWSGGEDHFYTGFKPEQGPGYGDFTMSPDVSYTVLLAAGSPEVSGLRLEACDNQAEGGWRLTFQNLRIPLSPEETPRP